LDFVLREEAIFDREDSRPTNVRELNSLLRQNINTTLRQNINTTLFPVIGKSRKL